MVWPAAGILAWPSLDLLLEVKKAGIWRTLRGSGEPYGFTPRFLGAAAGQHYTGFNISVEVNEGKGEITGPRPADPPPSFLIAITGLSDSGGTAIVPSIRIHVHDAVSAVWLTPELLTVRGDDSGKRLSVLAEFADGADRTVADISGLDGLVWNVVSVGAYLDIDPLSGEMTAGPPDSSEGTTIERVGVTLPATFGGLDAETDILIGESWSALGQASYADILEDGPAAIPGEDRQDLIDNYTNILFLPSGFLDSEEHLFRDFARQVVRRLQRRSITNPFNRLKDSVNYWAAFIPSSTLATSCLYEMVPAAGPGGVAVGGECFREPFRGAFNDPAQMSKLFLIAGFPMSGDAARSFAAKDADFRNWYGGYYTLIGTNADVYEAWRDMSEHFALNEEDTLFGLAHGQRPQGADYGTPRGIGWDDFRMSRETLDNFLSQLTDDSGNDLGQHFVFDSATNTYGKDYNYVIVLCDRVRHGGQRTGSQDDPSRTDLIALSFSREPKPAIQAGDPAGTLARELATVAAPTAKVSNHVHAVTAHELSHAIFLGDEYGGDSTVMAADVIMAAEIQERYTNLIHRSDLLDAGQISGDKIKWRWPRILKAARLIADVIQDGARYKLTVQSDHVLQFAVGEEVYLRGQHLTKVGLPPANYTAAHTYVSSKLEIQEVAGDSEEGILFVSVSAGQPPFSHLDWTSGGVVLSPQPASAAEYNAATYPFAEILPKAVRDHINANHQPLNVDLGAVAAYDCSQNPRRILWPHASNLPAGIPGGKKQAWITGLSEGGREANCNIYHAAGICQMRSHTVPTAVIVNGALAVPPFTGTIYRYCHVCRYTIVDTIDPKVHSLINSDYDDLYF